MKKEAILTAIMLVQQLKKDYWLSSEYHPPLQQAIKGNCRPLLEKIIEKLEEQNILVKEAYIIKHDQDEVSVWNSEQMKTIIDRKSVV